MDDDKAIRAAKLTLGAVLDKRRAKSAVERAQGQIAPSKYLPNVPRQVHADGGRVYPLDDRSGWYGDANYQQTGGKLEMMSPDEYLSKVRPLDIDDASRDNIDDLKQHILSGRKLDPLKIDANGREDGRHRAHAAKELGIKQVPVLTWPRDERADGGPAAPPPVDLGQVREQKQLQGFHQNLMSDVDNAVSDRMQAHQKALDAGVFDGYEVGDTLKGKVAPLKITGRFVRPWKPSMQASFDRLGAQPTLIEHEGKQYVPMLRTLTGVKDSGGDWQEGDTYLDLVKAMGYPKMGGLRSVKADGGEVSAKDRFLAGNHPAVPEVLYHGNALQIARKGWTDEIDHDQTKRNMEAQDFRTFKPSEHGNYGKGIYLTDKPEVASNFAQGIRADQKEAMPFGQVLKLHVSMKQPFTDATLRHPAWRDYIKKALTHYSLNDEDLKARKAIFDALDNGTATVRDLFLRDTPRGTMVNQFGQHDIHDTIRNSGFDGIIAHRPEGGKEYVAFKPEQVKSAISAREFDPDSPDMTKADGGSVGPEIDNPMSIFPKPQRMFPEDQRPPGGQYLAMPDKTDVTGHKAETATIGVQPGGKPFFHASRNAVDETGTPGRGSATVKTNLFKQKAGWRWQDAPEGHETTDTIVSVEHRGKHFYTLNAHFPKGVDLARYENAPSEPRLRPTTKGGVETGPQAGTILVRGKAHPVYHHVIVKAEGGAVDDDNDRPVDLGQARAMRNFNNPNINLSPAADAAMNRIDDRYAASDKAFKAADADGIFDRFPFGDTYIYKPPGGVKLNVDPMKIVGHTVTPVDAWKTDKPLKYVYHGHYPVVELQNVKSPSLRSRIPVELLEDPERYQYLSGKPKLVKKARGGAADGGMRLYSKAAQIIRGMKEQPTQVEDIIAYATGKGAKKSEIDHTDPPRGGMARPSQVAQHIEDMQPQIGVIRREAINFRYGSDAGYAQALREAEDRGDHARAEDINREWERFASYGGESDPRYARYQLPGADNYREHILTLDSHSHNDPYHARMHWGRTPNPLAHIRMNDRYEMYDNQKLVDALNRAREASSAKDIPTALQDGVSQGIISAEEAATIAKRMDMKSSAFYGKPDLDKKILHIEEMQSDWNNDARRKGFRTGNEQDQYDNYVKQMRQEAIAGIDPTASPMIRQSLAQKYQTMDPHMLALKLGRQTVHNELARRTTEAAMGVPQAPYINPKRDDWAELAMKHVLSEAAKGGYTGISFTPDEAQSDRWGGTKFDGIYNKKMPGIARRLIQQHDDDVGPDSAMRIGPYTAPVLDLSPQARDSINQNGFSSFRRGGAVGFSNGGMPDDQSSAASGAAPAAQGAVPNAGGVRGSAGVLQASVEGPLEGLPAAVRIPLTGQVIQAGPDPRIRAVAKAYMAQAGLPYNPPTKYAKVDPARARRIAKAYDAMTDDADDPLTRASYAAMIKETLAQYEAAKAAGFKAEFWNPRTQRDPYEASPRLAVEDVRDNHHMWVYPTYDGYGSAPITEEDARKNPMLQLTGETWNGIPVTVNDIFRAVHDYFGHAKEGVGFRHDGEENAWRSHASMYSPLARLAMTSETRGQNSWLNFGPHGAANQNARTEDTVFAPQKVGILPHWVHHEGAEDFMGPEDVEKMRRVRAKYSGEVAKALELSRRFTTGGVDAILKPKS